MRARAGNRAEFFRASRRDLKKVARCVDDAARAGKRQVNPFAKGLPQGSVNRLAHLLVLRAQLGDGRLAAGGGDTADLHE